MIYQNSRLKGGFGQCTSTVMRDPNLKIRDKAVYAYLCTFADSINNQLTVSVLKMASELNITPITVKRSLKELETKQIISRINRGRGLSKVTVVLK
jgi:predicted transcriptional regulator